MMFFFFLIAIIVGIPVVYRVVPLGDIVVVRFVRINVSFRVFTCCYSSWRSSCCRFCHCYLFLLVLLFEFIPYIYKKGTSECGFLSQSDMGTDSMTKYCPIHTK